VKYVLFTGYSAAPSTVQMAGVKNFPVPQTYDRKSLIGIYLHNDIFGPYWLTTAEKITIRVLLQILPQKLSKVIGYRVGGWSLIIDGGCLDLSLLRYVENDI
jgi:hypothetical protein